MENNNKVNVVFQAHRGFMTSELSSYLIHPTANSNNHQLLISTQFLNTLAHVYLFGVLPFGIVSNILLFSLFKFKIKNTVEAFYMPTMAVLNTFILVLFSQNYVDLSGERSQLWSNFRSSCQLRSYLLSVLTGLVSWLLVFLHYDLNLIPFRPKFTNRVMRRRKICLLFLILILLLALNSTDFVFLQTWDYGHALKARNISPSAINNQTEMYKLQICYVRSFKIYLILFLIDFIGSFLLPFVLICYQVYVMKVKTFHFIQSKSNFTVNSIREFKLLTVKLIMSPTVFCLFLMPAFFFSFLTNLNAHLVETADVRTINLLVRFLLISGLVYQSHYAFVFVINLTFDKVLKKIFLRKCLCI